MKKLFTSILLLSLCASVFAQDPIKNFSFENWSTSSDNKEYPTDWDYDKEAVKLGYIKKHSSGSVGSTALYMEKFTFDANFIRQAPFVIIQDQITTVPTVFTFDYILD